MAAMKQFHVYAGLFGRVSPSSLVWDLPGKLTFSLDTLLGDTVQPVLKKHASGYDMPDLIVS